MNDAKWIETLRGILGLDLSLTEATEIQTMIRDGDLLHIDGQVVRALDDLATSGRAEYLGISISRLSNGIFEVKDGGNIAIADGALEAIIMCEARRSKFRATPLREPEPPTYDEAREREEMKLKGMV